MLMTGYYYACGLIFTVLSSLYYVTEPDVWFNAWAGDWVVWMALAGAVIFGTVMCYTFMAYAASKVSATIISLYMTLQPPLTAIFGLIILDERLSYMQAVGALLIILGLFVAVGSAHQQEKQEQQHQRLRNIEELPPSESPDDDLENASV